MNEKGRGTDGAERRPRRFLSPQQKYEIWVQLLRGETTISDAADRARVDRATVMKLKTVAREGALEALSQSRPGTRRGNAVDPELVAAKVEIARLSEALKEMGVRLMLVEGKGAWG